MPRQKKIFSENDVEYEISNWIRFCRSGPWPHPTPKTHCGSLESFYISDELWPDDEVKPIPVHLESAKIVQEIYDSSEFLVRKVLQAEYLSPWNYTRIQLGADGAARFLKISRAAYDNSLLLFKSLIKKKFREIF